MKNPTSVTIELAQDEYQALKRLRSLIDAEIYERSGDGERDVRTAISRDEVLVIRLLANALVQQADDNERHARNERALTKAFGEPGTVTRVDLPS